MDPWKSSSWLLIVLAGTCGGQGRTPSISFADQVLASHNAVRGRVKVDPLTWSNRLAARSQVWADSLLSRNQFRHSPNSPYGENLFEIRGAGASPSQVVEEWAVESRNYDYRSNQCRAGMCGHYTQIVWNSTREVGCAVARGRGREVWVCTYDPPGNWVGKRPF